MIPRRTATAFALALGLIGLSAGMARGQSGSITIAAGDASSANIAAGAQFTVPLIVDMSGASGLNLGSLVTRVTWSAPRFTLDSIRSTAFTLATGASVQYTIGSGTASIAMFSASGTTTTATVANLYFTAAMSTAGSRIQLSPTAAGSEVGTSITSHVRGRSLDVCVAPQTPWGDANGDGTVNIIDAQQIARFGVGLSVANSSAIVAGDVDANGKVDIQDALAIAQSLVGVAVSSRIGTMASSVPPITGVSIQPTTLDVGVGQSVQLLAVPQDANGTPLTGCTPLSWTTADGTIDTVDVNGIVSGRARGLTTITATAVDGTHGTMTLTVSDPIATLSMSQDTATIGIGGTLALTATAKDAGGAVLPSTPTFTSSDPSIATVSSTGQVNAVNVGPVTITASVQDKTVSTTVQVSPLAENSLATGDDFSCVLSVTGAAYCWGSDSTFQLGDATTTNRSRPVAVAVPASLRFVQIVAGDKSVCALATTQSVYCWGAKYPSGVLVNPTLASDTLHVQDLTGWGRASNGGICMLNLQGTAYCLGNGTRGQMGTGQLVDNTSLHAVNGSNVFQSITSGLYAVCGLSSGSAYCWGENSQGSLGTSSLANAAEPNPVIGPPSSFSSLIAGRTLTCGVSGGAGYCWGIGLFGADGSGNVNGTKQTSPTQITGNITFQTIWGQTGPRDNSASCGLTSDGTAYCWGSNSSGQLGTTETLPLPLCGSGPCTGTPTLVTTSEKFVTLRPGGEHACGITTDHQVYCWGNDASGQVGDGGNTDVMTPVPVDWGSLRVRVP